MNSTQPTPACIAKLRSRDPAERNEGADEALEAGAAVLPALLPLLDESDAEVRAQATCVLAQLAAPQAADRLLQARNDESEQVRAYAAQGLARIQHPQALNACLKAIDDAPDPLHLDRTPAAAALAEMGLKAVPPLLELLMSEGPTTRLHAQRALELLLCRLHGFRPGQGFPSPEAEEKVRAEWQANGDYDSDQDAAGRAAAVEKWRQWLRSRTAQDG